MGRQMLVVATVLMLAASPLGAGGISVLRVATGLEQPVYVTAPPGDTSRLFIVEANSGGSGGSTIARIKILDLTTGAIAPTPFLTIGGIPQIEDQGLFCLAFHPNYADNGFFYVTYAFGEAGGESRIERYRVSDADPGIADPASATTILSFFKPFYNHNGDWLGFSPAEVADGKYYLYHTTGDGGSNLDPLELAQDPSKRNGKVLRVDVGADGLADDFPADPDENFAIPPDNPYVGVAGADPSIWSVGLRNPWRASFDRLTSDLYIGNVGANLADEVEFQPFDHPGGGNYQWSRLEGTGPGPHPGPATGADVFPMYECIHGGSLTACPQRSITGGYVYRGPVLALRGHYVFADFLGTYNFGNQTGATQIFSIQYDDSDPATFDGTNVVDGVVINRTAALAPDVGSLEFVSSFGEDATGNLYIVDMGNLGTPDGLGKGEIYKITGEDGYVAGLTLGTGPATPLSWSALPAAASYDVVKVDLPLLRANGGDYRATTLGCLENDSLDTLAADAQEPPPGGGFAYLVRGVNADGHGGSYDTASPLQVVPRDTSIYQSTTECP